MTPPTDLHSPSDPYRSEKGDHPMLTTTPIPHEPLTLGERLIAIAGDLEAVANRLDPAGDSAAAANRSLVEAFLGAMESGDVDGALACCGDDVRYTIPGRGSASGDHLGRAAVEAALRAETRAGGQTLQFLTHAVIGDGSPIVSYHEILAVLDGQPHRYRMLLLFGFVGGAIGEIHEFTDDQYLADDLFAPPPSMAEPARRWFDRIPLLGRRR
ncbi:MAG: nuclear transport factor 2 family protein [Actinomycetota bacterium]